MASNHLWLNPVKTDVILLGSHCYCVMSEHLHDLVVFVDCELTMMDHHRIHQLLLIRHHVDCWHSSQFSWSFCPQPAGLLQRTSLLVASRSDGSSTVCTSCCCTPCLASSSVTVYSHAWLSPTSCVLWHTSVCTIWHPSTCLLHACYWPLQQADTHSAHTNINTWSTGVTHQERHHGTVRLPATLHDTELSTDCFSQLLKQFLFCWLALVATPAIVTV